MQRCSRDPNDGHRQGLTGLSDKIFTRAENNVAMNQAVSQRAAIALGVIADRSRKVFTAS